MTLPTPPRPDGQSLEATAASALAILRGFAALRRVTGTYPAGHPMVTQRLTELTEAVTAAVIARPLRIDVVRGDICVDGIVSPSDGTGTLSIARELLALGIDSIHVTAGVDARELQAVADFLLDARS